MKLKYFLTEYLKNRPIFLSLARAKEAELYQQYLPLTSPVLDVGCGDGFFAKLAVGKADVGLDMADSRINEARTQQIYERLVLYDGKKMPFEDNIFKSVMCNSVLEHTDDPKRIIGECFRVLKPGGRMVVTVMTEKWEKYLLGRLIFGRRYENFMRKKQLHKHLLSYKQWSQIMEDAGFVIQERRGYLGCRACRWLDGFHYLSLPYLISYKLTGRWMRVPGLVRFFPVKWLENIVSYGENLSRAAGVLFVLQKHE